MQIVTLASAVKNIHLKNLLHNDFKSNNVLLKLRNNVWIPKLEENWIPLLEEKIMFRSRDIVIFVFFWNRRFQNFLRHHKHCCTYFFWIRSPIKRKFGQILVHCMTNIPNMFLAESWRLETSFRLFYDFIKMARQQDLAIFNGWHTSFLIAL